MSPKTLVVVILAVVLLAVGFAASQVLLRSPTTERGPGPKPPDKSPLEIVSDRGGLRYEEAYTPGFHAFRYRNKSNDSVKVGINWKNCKCAGVEICVAPQEWQSLEEADLAQRVDDKNLQWEELQKEGGGFTIPAHAVGWIRLAWKGDKGAGDQQFRADLWLFEPESGLSHDLSVPVKFVDPVSVRAEDDPEKPDSSVQRLSAGDKGVGHFLIMSSTRKKFTLEPDPSKKDPLLTYGDPTPLTKKELETISQARNSTFLSGYRADVTVHERVGDKQLDIGPFRRVVAWKSDATKMPIEGHVQGIVLGEVTIASGEKKEQHIEMGAINPRRPASMEFVLESDNPTVELTLDTARTADFLKIETPDGKEGKKVGASTKSWTVTISFDPESTFRGRFPDRERPGYESTGVVFKITHAGVQNEPERRIKVIVVGHVRPD